MPFVGQPGLAYTRAAVQDLLRVPNDRRKGDWLTGYTEYDGEFFVFCNIGVAGRTGHDYDNHWAGDRLIWRAKGGTTINQTRVQRLTAGTCPVHIFHRKEDRSPFIYAGPARAEKVLNTQPVTVHWSFDAKEINEEIATALVKAGFTLERPGVQTRRATLGALVVYLKQLTSSYPLVVGPEWEGQITDLKGAGGLRPAGRFYYHNSTMGSFPKRLNGGQADIPYGIDFGFAEPAGISRFLGVLTSARRANILAKQPQENSVDPVTETEVTRAVRLGQQRFRSDLLERYKGKCALTEIDMPEVLRASHIKPWSKSSGPERLDPDNGFLLVVHLDSLFDKGLISFSDDGKILVSTKLSNDARKTFGLADGMRIRDLTLGNLSYLRHHRKLVFMG